MYRVALGNVPGHSRKVVVSMRKGIGPPSAIVEPDAFGQCSKATPVELPLRDGRFGWVGCSRCSLFGSECRSEFSF